MKRKRCKDCGKLTDAGPCPGCGAVVCQLCAEREGAFCCDGENEFGPTPEDGYRKGFAAGIARAEEVACQIAAAYAQDRSEQYANSSGIRCALEDLAAELRDGEHIEAFKHGELDDLIKRARDNVRKRMGNLPKKEWV